MADQLLSLHPTFAAALAWLRATNLSALEAGQVPINGERLFANVETGHGHDPANRRFESHRRYIDWQYNISGGERMRHADARNLAIQEDLLAENDLCFHKIPPAWSDLLVPAGWLAVYEPHDAHMPSLRLAADDAQAYHKVVLKILIESP
jgi:YhcH/YjgK/YiaL family protein